MTSRAKKDSIELSSLLWNRSSRFLISSLCLSDIVYTNCHRGLIDRIKCKRQISNEQKIRRKNKRWQRGIHKVWTPYKNRQLLRWLPLILEHYMSIIIEKLRNNRWQLGSEEKMNSPVRQKYLLNRSTCQWSLLLHMWRHFFISCSVLSRTTNVYICVYVYSVFFFSSFFLFYWLKKMRLYKYIYTYIFSFTVFIIFI